MKVQKITIMAASIALGGLTLAGCQANASGSANGSSSTTQAAGAASAAPVNAQGTSSAAAGSTSTSQSGSGNGGSGSSGGSTATSYRICQSSDLRISLASQDNISSQIIQWVQLTNAASTPCTMDGFAGVNLVGSANAKPGYSWPLGRDSESYSKITLQVGESAYFGIKYLPWASGDGSELSVADIVLTPPNTTTSVTLPWKAGVLLQDAATHPGTYLTPIALGTNP